MKCVTIIGTVKIVYVDASCLAFKTKTKTKTSVNRIQCIRTVHVLETCVLSLVTLLMVTGSGAGRLTSSGPYYGLPDHGHIRNGVRIGIFRRSICNLHSGICIDSLV